jgi:hypothetical protein
MSGSRAEHSFLAVEAELRQERAAAMGRAGRRLEEQFERCRELGHQIEAAGSRLESDELVARYRLAREVYDECRWRLCVQREALGLYDHRWVDRVYPRLPHR